MTREEIERLEGRELDAAVAEHVMGLSVSNGRVFSHYEEDEFGEVSAVWVRVPRYCSDIAAAWQVIERMWDLGWYVDMGHYEDEWEVAFYNGLQRYEDCGWPPAAVICRAALLAVCGEAGDDG